MKLGSLLLVLGSLSFGACARSAAVPEEPLEKDPSASWPRRASVRAFYSGHSLSDGVPEAIAAIAGSLQREFDYDYQSLAGSLLRERTKGPDPKAEGFAGYRDGRNRRGEGLDVAARLRGEHHAQGAGAYDALVVTERHDLPYAAYHESTALYLAHIVEQLVSGNATAQPFLYHTWLEVDMDAPATWLRYERAARRLWECVASSANLLLSERSLQVRIRVLPGASALADLVEGVITGAVPGMNEGDTRRRLRWLFRDQVHLAPSGTYFMGLVHFSVLFGQSPEGAAAPADVPAAAVKHLQRLAWQHAREYAEIAAPAAARNMAACRGFTAYAICPAFSAYRGAHDAGLFARFSRMREIRRCQDNYLAPAEPQNPFR